jgi:CheY-like chemotaxis protein
MAGNGVEVVAMAADDVFDVILMDVQMPEMNGLDATAAIRAREQAEGRHVPIIAMTARAMPGDRERCLEAGMDGYVPKPLRADELYSAIDELAAAGPIPPDDAPPAPPTPPTPAAGSELIDRATLIANFGGLPGLVGGTIEVFLIDSEIMEGAVIGAAGRREARALADAAHKLKGSVGLFSRGTAWEVARGLEQQGLSGDLTGIDEVMANLRVSLSRLRTELRALRESL